jgi:hypothetical protein
MERNSLFSINLINFMKYKSEVACDKRVFFEAIIIKHLSFNSKSFYYSRKNIAIELGIKRDRATKIIQEFIELGFITIANVSSNQNGKPRQVNYFTLIPDKIPEAAQKLLKNSSEFVNKLKLLLRENES